MWDSSPSNSPSLVGAQPPPSCSFARHLVGKIVILAAHLLITIRTAQNHLGEYLCVIFSIPIASRGWANPRKWGPTKLSDY